MSSIIIAKAVEQIRAEHPQGLESCLGEGLAILPHNRDAAYRGLPAMNINECARHESAEVLSVVEEMTVTSVMERNCAYSNGAKLETGSIIKYVAI